MTGVALSRTIRCFHCHEEGIERTHAVCPGCGLHFESIPLLKPGTQIGGRYVIDYALGQGGFGVTYRAIHELMGDAVAIKEFFPQSLSARDVRDGTVSTTDNRREEYEKRLDRFIREGALLRKMEHAHVVRALDLFKDKGTAFLVMKLITGHSLRAHMDKLGGPMVASRIEVLMGELVGALDALHAKGIYHLDIKPDNVMLDGQGRAVLVDFGAARVGPSRHSTQAFSEAYAAPEVIAGRDVGPGSDLFELAMMLYEMLTGQLPPTALQRFYDDVWTLEDVDEPWRTLLQQGLHLKLINRPASVRAWWDDRPGREPQPQPIWEGEDTDPFASLPPTLREPITPFLRFEVPDGRIAVVPVLVERCYVSNRGMITSPGPIKGTINLSEEAFAGGLHIRRTDEEGLLIDNEPAFEGHTLSLGPYRVTSIFRDGDVACDDLSLWFDNEWYQSSRPFDRQPPKLLKLERGSGQGMRKLVIEDDEGKTTIVPLIRDELSIGRKEGNTIRLTERNVSRHHLWLIRSENAFFVEDRGSLYGTLKNGQKVAPRVRVPFEEGDTIQVGDYLLGLKTQPDPPHIAPEREPTTPEEKVARLVVLSPTRFGGLTFALDKPEMVIGRTEGEIRIDHRSISRNHAKILWDGERYKIIDLRSSNGTRVDGEEYRSVWLKRGSVIELGHVRIRFVAPGEKFHYTPSEHTVGDSPAEDGSEKPSFWKRLFGGGK